eukprot:5706949-Pyramimonas_sp.AAC.1
MALVAKQFLEIWLGGSVARMEVRDVRQCESSFWSPLSQPTLRDDDEGEPGARPGRRGARPGPPEAGPKGAE